MDIKGKILLSMGIVMVIIGLISIFSTFNFVQRAEKISGEITRIDKHPNSAKRTGTSGSTAYVRYKYNGEQYSNINIHEYSTEMRVGQYIYLYCDPDNPSHVEVASTIYRGPVLFLLLTGGFTAFVVFCCRRSR